MSLATQKLNRERIYKVVQIKEVPKPTIQKPITASLDPAIKICLERAELVTESYKKTGGQPWILRRALALNHLLRNMTIYILDGEQIVGNYASTPKSLSTFPEWSFLWLEDGLDNEFADTLDDKGKKRLRKINNWWADKNVENEIYGKVPENLKGYLHFAGAIIGSWFWPLGMMVPNYRDRVFPLGLSGLLKDVQDNRAKLLPEDPEFHEKSDFYEAAEISVLAVTAWIRRYAALAEKKAATAKGKLKKNFQTVAHVCSRVAEAPPETFHEALQSFYFYHLVTTQITWSSVGLGQRFDQLFYPFYEQDKKAGRITYDRAVELFEFLWIKLDDLGQINPRESCAIQVGGTKFQNVTIGGVDEKGKDATNELSFAVLDATINIQTLQPNVCLRYHDKIDPVLVDKAIDCIATGIGMPAIFNDDPVICRLFTLGPELLYPEGIKAMGIKGADIFQTVNGSNAMKKAVDAVSKYLPKPVYSKLDKTLHDWPYKLCAGWGVPGALLRGFLKRISDFDPEQALAWPRDNASVACVGVGSPNGMTIQGTLTTIITTGVLNFLKCFEYVMFQGIESATGDQIGKRTPDPRTFTSYEQFLDSFLEQIRYVLENDVKIFDLCDELYAEMTPRPFASVLMNTPVVRGRDATHKGDGADSEIFTMAPVNAADSLVVVKKLVFDEKSVTMDELINACAANWEGFESLRKRCLDIPKFGNDDDYADTLLDDMYQKAAKTIEGVKNRYGVPCRPEATLAGGYFFGGLVTGATPDGRKRGETVSDGQLSPMHGMDKNGPTAVLKSCSKVDPTRSWNQLFNQKMHPSFLKGKNKKIFASYLRTWYEFGNWHVQFNCQDAKTLRDAQAHPEKHANLTVRVAGYSAHFVDLMPGLQNDIIRRTEQDLSNFSGCAN